MTIAASVLVHEFITAGGLAESAEAEDAELHAQGAAMRNAMLEDLLAIPGLTVACASTAADSLPAAAAGVARIAADPGESQENFLRRVSPSFDRVWVVAPETGGMLARLHAAVGPQRWLGADATAIRVASSKRATRRRQAAFRLTVPCDCDSLQSPHTAWVVKPDDGVGAQAIRLHEELTAAWRDFAGRLGRGQAATLEAWVEGAALSLSVLSARGGVEVLSVNRQTIDVDAAGRVVYRGVEHWKSACTELRDLAQTIQLAIPGLSGYWGIDLVLRENRRPVVIEVNPRLTCAYAGLSTRLGRNLAAEMLASGEVAAVPGTDCRPETGLVGN